VAVLPETGATPADGSQNGFLVIAAMAAVLLFGMAAALGSRSRR
jgi:hypothetical protein